MPVITKEQLENASLDADDLASFVNDAAGDVTPRLGIPYPNLRKFLDNAGAEFDTYVEGLSTDNRSLFRSEVTDDYMRNLVRDLKIEGGYPNHEYILNYETQYFDGIPLYRVRFIVTDVTLGIDVCMWSRSAATDWSSNQPETCNFHYGAITTGYVGIYATAWIDWSVIAWDKPLTTYTTSNQSGIWPNRVITNDQLDEFLERPDPKIHLTVGDGAITTTHFNTIYQAWLSLILPGITVSRSVFPLTDVCSLTNQVLIEVIDDGYEEEIAVTTIGGIDQSTIVMPPGMTLRLKADSVIYADTATTAPVFECPHSCRIEQPGGSGGIEIRGGGAGYCLHVDSGNSLSFLPDNPDAKPYLAHRIRTVIAATFRSEAGHNTWIFGCGISNGQTILLDGARAIRADGERKFFFVHNTAGEVIPGRIIFKDTYFNDSSLAGAYAAVQLYKGSNSDIQHEVTVINSDLAKIEVTNGGGITGDGFIRRGKIDSDITIVGTLPK